MMRDETPDQPEMEAESSGAAESDARVYVPSPEGWEARIKQGWEKDYCYARNPGEDWFHMLLNGEVFLQRGSEKYCLNCAVRRGIVTSDRLYWQHQARTSADRLG